MPEALVALNPSAYSYPLLLKHLLHTPLAHAPAQEIVYRGQRRHTYADLQERIGRLAGGLAGLGVQPGSTVAVMDWDSHRYLEAYFAVPMMGAVLLTVNVRLSPEQIAYTLDHAGARVLLVHADFVPLLEAIRARLPGLERVVLIADGGAAPPGAFDAEYEALLAETPPLAEFPDFDENTRATTFYTTGTTGLPKGVYFSHRQLVLHTLALAAALANPPSGQRFHRGDVYMPLTPMFHVHAWGIPYVATLMGVKQVYPGRYVPELLLDLVAKERVTFSHCVPAILHMLLSSPRAQQVDLRGWKLIIGGSALPKALAAAALKRGIDIYAGYGMSETCPVLTLAQLRPGEEAPGSEAELDLRCKTGLPIPLVDLRVVDEQMQPRPHDGHSTGEVVVRAPWLTQGYLGDEPASRALWRGGYLHTQDLGSVDAAGYLKLTDRLKDVIKSGGEWISSLDLEDAIARHPGVAEVAVIGIADERWGERPLALVVPRAGTQPPVDEAAIKAHVTALADQGLIAKICVPARVLLVQAIARTSVGKIDKKALRAQYGANPPG